jgi:uncharacterized membrane protein YbhN (UPF0104 family)
MPGWLIRSARIGAGIAVLAAAVAYLAAVADGGAIGRAVGAVLADPAGLAGALLAYAAAFALRSWSWRSVLPALSFGQSWAALHVSLLGNHVLPLRLGEVLRVTSVLRRTGLPARPVTASAVTLRSADVLAVLLLAGVAAPGLLPRAGGWLWLAAAAVAGILACGLLWTVRLRRGGSEIRLPGPAVLGAAIAAWILESAVIWEIARQTGHAIGPAEAIAVTAVTIAAQFVAITPGGFGSYEAAATVALVAAGVPAGPAFAIALVTHAVKTAYSIAVGAVALVVPAPSYWGHLRLPKRLPARPAGRPVGAGAPVVAFIPAFNEEAAVGAVIRRLPAAVAGHPLVTIVVDDGSADATAAVAAAAGAVVVAQPRNLGLGAAVRRGLAEATARQPAAVIYLDADGEYFPEDIEELAAPVLAGTADYVVGSRFRGRIDRMLPHRRFGNLVLTRWVRWLTRRRDLTDGQSGYRAFSPAAAASAEIIHDYNYAQVLTLDLLAKGFVYTEVPIRYAFRETGTSFIRLGRYLRKVIPAVHRELNAPAQVSRG